MDKKFPCYLCWIFFLPLFFIYIQLHAQKEKCDEPKHAEENETCFKCHGQKNYFYFNEWIERELKERMNPYFVIPPQDFYVSNHKNFRCTDCHSEDYKIFPHSGELRMELKYTCMDCHEGDPNYSEFHFENINEEFQKSVHSQKHDEDFTCWMCHNPHSYKINARNTTNIKNTIAYDNEICLSCHADLNKYSLLTEQTNPNIIEKHDWLPNQAAHFLNVRCIECHAENNDSILVAHNVQPKEKAVKLCVKCHSRNSLLMASLYKFQFKGEKAGFYNAAMLEESYVIGANRNYYLNLLSIIITCCVLVGIAIHSILRITKL